MDFHLLMVQKLYAGPTMLSAAPILPQERSRTNWEGMQQQAHLAWFLGGAALPLTLLTQLTRTAVANAGRIDHAQAPIRRSCGVSVLPAGQRRVPSGWRGKSEPVKRPVFQEVAVVGGPYPAAGGNADGCEATGSRCSEMAGANSVVRSGCGLS